MEKFVPYIVGRYRNKGELGKILEFKGFEQSGEDFPKLFLDEKEVKDSRIDGFILLKNVIREYDDNDNLVKEYEFPRETITTLEDGSIHIGRGFGGPKGDTMVIESYKHFMQNQKMLDMEKNLNEKIDKVFQLLVSLNPDAGIDGNNLDNIVIDGNE